MQMPAPGTTSAATSADAPHLVLYGRTWCHLCDDMRVALEPFAAAAGARVDVIDVDSDPALVALYDELVPVLVCDGVEVCHYWLDEARVRAALGVGA
jgi:thiol-disulfide isomerase/thioredoxin